MPSTLRPRCQAALPTGPLLAGRVRLFLGEAEARSRQVRVRDGDAETDQAERRICCLACGGRASKRQWKARSQHAGPRPITCRARTRAMPRSPRTSRAAAGRCVGSARTLPKLVDGGSWRFFHGCQFSKGSVAVGSALYSDTCPETRKGEPRNL